MDPGSNNLQRCLTTGILFLATLALQVEVVYACRMLAGMPQGSCCCEETTVNGCDRKVNGNKSEGSKPEQPCCRVTVAPGQKASLSMTAAAIPTEKTFLKTPPPFFLHPISNNVVAVPNSDRHPALNNDPAARRGAAVYLLTQRFRE